MDHGSGWRRSGTKLLVSTSALFITSELNWVYCLWVGQGPFTSSEQKRTWKQKSKETFCFPMTCFLFVPMHPSHFVTSWAKSTSFFWHLLTLMLILHGYRSACTLISKFPAACDISCGPNTETVKTQKKKQTKKTETSCWKILFMSKILQYQINWILETESEC